MPQIAVRHLSRNYRAPDGSRLEVLRDFCVEIDRGAFVSIVGPSGCGKSTLLSLLAGLDAPASGEIAIAGQPVGHGGAPARVGLVFQQPRLLAWRTVERNVSLPLEALKVPRADARARVHTRLELVGLAAYASYLPHQLSGGMQQRVALARALVIDPDILLMDEPFSSLDALTARRMRDELVRVWHRTGTTIVFVTHDIAESVFLSQAVCIVTPKPSSVFARIAIELPYPRQHEDDRLFGIEKRVTREFFKMDGGPED